MKEKYGGGGGSSGGAVGEIALAVFLVLVAAVAFAGQKGGTYGKHIIHGKPANRHAIERLLEN